MGVFLKRTGLASTEDKSALRGKEVSPYYHLKRICRVVLREVHHILIYQSFILGLLFIFLFLEMVLEHIVRQYISLWLTYIVSSLLTGCTNWTSELIFFHWKLSDMYSLYSKLLPPFTYDRYICTWHNDQGHQVYLSI